MEPNTLIQDLKTRLEKKATFEHALTELTAVVADQSITMNADELLGAVGRCFTLLKTRYSNRSFWTKGRALFAASLGLPVNPDQKANLQRYLDEASAFCTTEADLQQSRRQQPESTVSEDALDMVDILMAEQSTPYTLTDLGPVEDAPLAAGATTEPARRAEERRNLQQSILEGIQAVYSGMEAVARGTEAIERQMETVLNVFNSRPSNRPPPPPPASKSFVQRLPKITISEERAEEFKECSCAICTDELRLGDEVQVLPCRHMFHPACVAPWFSKHNSCPVCRHELPTDDLKYEARKEAAAEEEAERRGQANAVSHMEHMYI